MIKTCNICNKREPDVAFYENVNSRCKECHKAAVRANRRDKAAQYKEYEKRRYKTNPNRSALAKIYAQSDRGKEKAARSKKKYHERNPEKRQARIKVSNAIRAGILCKPEKCERCGKYEISRKIHAHHHDYMKPLEVEWICSGCHGLEHFGPPPDARAPLPRGRHVPPTKGVNDL